MNFKTIGILLFTFGICTGFFGATSRQIIVQSGFDAFVRGNLGSSEANLYVSRSGRIQTINQWDLNADGYNDVLISNDHDACETVDAFVY